MKHKIIPQVIIQVFIMIMLFVISGTPNVCIVCICDVFLLTVKVAFSDSVKALIIVEAACMCFSAV